MSIVEFLVKNLTSLATALATICVAVVATRALRTWKEQTRADRHINFMDELTDVAHEYIQAMNAPVEFLCIVEIGIQSHSKVAAISPGAAEKSGVIAYIQKSGKEDQAKLCEYSDKVRPMAGKLSSLSAKGQVMGFEKYDQCHEACTMLVWSLKQIDAVAMMIGNPNYNWENEQVQQTLDKVMSVKSQSIKENLEKHNRMLLEFVRHNYQRLLT